MGGNYHAIQGGKEKDHVARIALYKNPHWRSDTKEKIYLNEKVDRIFFL